MPAHSAGPFGTAGGAYYSIAPEGPNLRGNPAAPTLCGTQAIKKAARRPLFSRDPKGGQARLIVWVFSRKSLNCSFVVSLTSESLTRMALL